jgi:hypothetical protein
VKDYGPPAFIVTFAGFLIAASAALRALWAGKFLWDPDLGYLERSAVKVGGLITAIALAVAFASFYGDLKDPRLIGWTIGVGAAALLFFLVDVALRQSLFLQCTPTSKRIVRGFRTTKRTRDLLGDKPMARIKGDIAEGDHPPPSARAFFLLLTSQHEGPRYRLDSFQSGGSYRIHHPHLRVMVRSRNQRIGSRGDVG